MAIRPSGSFRRRHGPATSPSRTRRTDRTDALKDINLVFPLERLRELEAERVIGRLAEHHYGFGLMGSARRLMPSIQDVARRIRAAQVDLALLVPA